MSQYWVKSHADGEAVGPYTAEQLHSYVASGQLTPAHLLSADGVNWHRGAEVKGLFDRAATAPAPMAPLPVAQRMPVAPLDYRNYRTAAVGAHEPPRPRNPLPFLVAAVFMTIGGLTMVIGLRMASQLRDTEVPGLGWALAGSCSYFVAGLVCLILWLVWLGGIHRDIASLTGGRHPITGGKAVGFSFIPFFNVAWVIYMPWKLAVEVDTQLKARGQSLPPTLVVVMQILSVIPGAFLPGLTAIFYAVSMWYIQGGMNRLLAMPQPAYADA